ncbi:MAG: hypothetical protein H7838_07365 [Magnetococcus sp. DMHC-8]
MSGRWVAEEVLLALVGGSALRAELAKRLPDRQPEQISTGLYTLRDNGLAVVVNRQWSLTAAGVAAANAGEKLRPDGQANANKRTLRHRAWQALRRKGGKSTIPDLLRVLDCDGRENANNLAKYFRGLESVGILLRLRHRAAGTALTSPGHVVWVIVSDPGPKAPVWQPGKRQAFDPNTGTVHPVLEWSLSA